jgi:hypothetical protein
MNVSKKITRKVSSSGARFWETSIKGSLEGLKYLHENTRISALTLALSSHTHTHTHTHIYIYIYIYIYI